MIEFNFRNAPPRPPVGPCFVGLSNEGMLNQWTKYRAFNAVETGYSWKLHAESDLGVPLAPGAMDLKCYKDPSDNPKNSKRRKLPAGYDDDENDPMDDDDENLENSNGNSISDHKNKNNNGPPPLHPDDSALINWKGSLGDTAAEQLQIRRDRARAEARALSQGKTIPSTAGTKHSLERIGSSTSHKHQSTKKNKNKRRSFDHKSRVLNEKPQSWMMRTTYISNDASRKIHDFTSASAIKKRSAKEVDKKMEETKAKIFNPDTIEAGFHMANSKSVRKHPSKRHLKPVFDFPLLPDVDTWGNTYTHVVLDKPPKLDSSLLSYKGQNANATLIDRISRAFITDVEKREGNSKMLCKLLAPEHSNLTVKYMKEDQHIPNYEVTQTYDLDVIPLKDENSPHINFFLIIDEEKGVVKYHPVSSRVQLSTGRPDRPDKSIIEKRTLSENDVRDIEMRAAEIDEDLEKKYAINDGGDDGYDDEDGNDDDDDDGDDDDDDDDNGGNINKNHNDDGENDDSDDSDDF